MKILVLRPDHIGDMLLTTPFLSALRQTFPQDELSVLCGSWSLPVLKNNPNIDKIVECNFPWLARGGSSSWRSFFSTIVDLRLKKFDMVFNLRKAVKTAGAARAVNGKETWGFDVSKSKWAHTHTIPYRTDRHIADLYVDFITALKSSPVKNDGLQLFLDEDELSKFKPPAELPDHYAVFSPGAGYPEKLWMNERWAETADKIVDDLNIPVVFIGSDTEVSLVSAIKDRMKHIPADLTGKLSIREAGILIKNAQFLVSVDSAAMHIASAVRTPVAALFGPTNPVHWGPYPNGRANQILSKVVEFKLGRGSTNRSGGMDLLSVDDVVSAVTTLCSKENIQTG